MDDEIKYYESYGYTHEEAVNQAKADRASNNLIIALFRLLFICFRLFLLLLPSIFSGYLIVRWLRGPLKQTETWEYFGWMCGTVYLLECIVFFLKGWQIALRQRSNRIWIAIFTVSILYRLAIPVILFQFLIAAEI